MILLVLYKYKCRYKYIDRDCIKLSIVLYRDYIVVKNYVNIYLFFCKIGKVCNRGDRVEYNSCGYCGFVNNIL